MITSADCLVTAAVVAHMQPLYIYIHFTRFATHSNLKWLYN